MTFSAGRPFWISMANTTCALLVILTSTVAAADPAKPSRDVAALISASVAAGDWRLHPVDESTPTLTVTPLLSVDLRGLHANRNHVELAAAGAALIGALLIAGSRSGSWCSGPACDAGVAALFVAAPLLDAAARDERNR